MKTNTLEHFLWQVRQKLLTGFSQNVLPSWLLPYLSLEVLFLISDSSVFVSLSAFLFLCLPLKTWWFPGFCFLSHALLNSTLMTRCLWYCHQKFHRYLMQHVQTVFIVFSFFSTSFHVCALLVNGTTSLPSTSANTPQNMGMCSSAPYHNISSVRLWTP